MGRENTLVSLSLLPPRPGRFRGRGLRRLEGRPFRLGLGEFVKFVQFGLQQLLVGQTGLILGDQGR